MTSDTKRTPRAQIYIGDDMSRVLGPTDRTGDLQSRLGSILLRYEAAVKAIMPAFSRNEWCAIFDANNGTDIFQEAAELQASGLWANVEDCFGLDDKWQIDTVDLLRRMKSLSLAELLAVREAVTRFWMHCDLPTDDAMQASWANVSE